MNTKQSTGAYIISEVWKLAPYLYLALPILIFIGGFMKIYIAIPCILLICACLFSVYKKTESPLLPLTFKQNWRIYLGIFAIILVWVYLSGIGKLTFQNSDHFARNSLFEGLVNNSWPLTAVCETAEGYKTYGLSYYIGFWLPSALIGKLAGLSIGYFSQILWAALGIYLFYLLYCSYTGKMQYWPLLVFIGFSGLDAIGYFMFDNDLSALFAPHIEIWCQGFQFSSFTTQLFWVFNQTIPIWVALMLLLVQKKNRFIVFILGLIPLSSTLPFIGILPFAAYLVFSRKYPSLSGSSHFRSWLKDTFTWENILGGGVTGILSFLYLKVNVMGSRALQTSAESFTTFCKSASPMGVLAVQTNGLPLPISTPAIATPIASSLLNNICGGNNYRGFLFMLLAFLFLDALVYYIAIHKYQYRNPLYLISLFTLLLCPIIHIGDGDDFCMRASIPALLVLWMLVVDTLRKAYAKKDKLVMITLVILLLIGSLTPLQEFLRTTSRTADAYLNNEAAYYDTWDIKLLILPGTNFAGNIEDSFFFQHLAKPSNPL